MKKVMLGLFIGLVIGYQVGYGHGANGDPSVWKQVMDKFGASRLREESGRRDQLMDSISKAREGATEPAH